VKLPEKTSQNRGLVIQLVRAYHWTLHPTRGVPCWHLVLLAWEEIRISPGKSLLNGVEWRLIINHGLILWVYTKGDNKNQDVGKIGTSWCPQFFHAA
jgi:hypothetical protein